MIATPPDVMLARERRLMAGFVLPSTSKLDCYLSVLARLSNLDNVINISELRIVHAG
jgi:hypothetical protein